MCIHLAPQTLVTRILAQSIRRRSRGSTDVNVEIHASTDCSVRSVCVQRCRASMLQGILSARHTCMPPLATFARFGYLYMTDGMWNGSRLLPEGWVEYSRTPIARDPDNDLDYGAHVWMFPHDPGSIAALGYEGQFTWASPQRQPSCSEAWKDQCRPCAFI
jgi:hypothetical protein